MGPLATGLIALVPFPFSDLSGRKLRPAFVLAHAGRGDWILGQITSQPFGDDHALRIAPEHLVEGRLRFDSFVRLGKRFTASGSLVPGTLGKLHPAASSAVVDCVVAIVRAGP